MILLLEQWKLKLRSSDLKDSNDQLLQSKTRFHPKKAECRYIFQVDTHPQDFSQLFLDQSYQGSCKWILYFESNLFLNCWDVNLPSIISGAIKKLDKEIQIFAYQQMKFQRKILLKEQTVRNKQPCISYLLIDTRTSSLYI